MSNPATHIGFNKPYLTGKETDYIREAVNSGKISGDGLFTKKCHSFFEEKYGFKKCLLTTSCTDALEMAAILLDIRPGDEVIAPSYTFVSTVNPFILRGARIVFVDSSAENPNLDVRALEAAVTARTKAIVVVHYAGIACDMDPIMELARKSGIYVVEDAAQAIDSYYKSNPLGGLGHLAAFSFHETKNIISGEGGMLVINDDAFLKRAEIIREKGTNRSAFFRGEIDKYGWVDVGSSFLPSEIIAAFLYAQIENLTAIQERRRHIWNRYWQGLQALQEAGIQLPRIPDYATNNAHIFYLVCKDIQQRDGLLQDLKDKRIQATFHYQSLHKSSFFTSLQNSLPSLKQCERYSDCLVRLPFYFELSDEQVDMIISYVKATLLRRSNEA